MEDDGPEAWIKTIIPQGSDFTLDNLPWGVFKDENTPGSVCVAVGNHVVDVHAWALSWTDDLGFGDNFGPKVKDALLQTNLNAFLELGKEHWVSVRNALRAALLAYNPTTGSTAQLRLIPMEEVAMLLPIAVRDYTDFYCSKEHATNVGTMFRGKDNALNPNWLHMPIGYHGRASSIVLSGAAVPRPWGQVPGSEGPQFRPSQKLDFELELACVLGGSTPLGCPIHVADARRHIFGYMLMNDCSARDIQKWEYVPLGPFNGKNFATVVSPWIVQQEALEPFMCAPPEQVPAPLAYLQEPTRSTFDITMRVAILPAGIADASVTVTTAKFRDLYWTFEQMLAHHTAGGCNIASGDIIASGTISSEGEGCQGCMLELTENGKRPVQLGSAGQRAWLEDGDVVAMTAGAEKGRKRVGFGSCAMTVAPAVRYST